MPVCNSFLGFGVGQFVIDLEISSSTDPRTELKTDLKTHKYTQINGLYLFEMIFLTLQTI
jgi:hypothetical protein